MDTKSSTITAILVAAAFAAVFLGKAGAGIIAGPLVNPGTGNTYYLLDQASWVHSQFEARELGGNLATVNDAAENAWIVDNFNNFGGEDRGLWIGLHDTRVADSFEWISGDPSGFRAWGNGQPNDGFGGQQYVAILTAGFLRAEGWGDQPDGTSDFLGTPYHGVVEVQAGALPPQRDAAFAFSNFDEPAEGAADYIPGPGASELGFSTLIFSADGADPTSGTLPTSTTPTRPVFHHRSIDARTIFDNVRLLERTEVLVTVDVQARFTTYEPGDRVRIYASNLVGEELDLLSLEGDALDAFAGQGYREVSVELPESWRDARLVFESSTNSSQSAERIDIDNVAFRSPQPPRAPEIVSFVAEAASIPSGAEAELSWSVLGAETVTIEPGGFGAISPVGGSLRFTPGDTHTYTLRAENDAGVSTREFTIEVQAPLFGARHDLGVGGIDPISVHAADLNGDGAVEVLVAAEASGEILLFSNDSIGNLDAATVISSQAAGASSVQTADLDGDGDLDIISTSATDRKLAWYENIGEASGQFGPQQVVDIGGFETRAIDAHAADLDGDGDQDLIAAFWNSNGGSGLFAWYENLDAGTFAGRRILSDIFPGAATVSAADLDGDMDLDIIGGAAENDRVLWFENLGGGLFSAFKLIGNGSSPHADSVIAADLDGDSDLDVLSTWYAQDQLRWYENLGGGMFGAPRTIATDYEEPYEVRVADLDGDGDLDVLSAAFSGRVARWHANLGGGLFSSPLVLFEGAERGGSVFPSDVDADGDLDVLFTGQGPDTVGWIENLRIVNAAPELVNPIADVEIDEDSGAYEVPLGAVFTDPEDGPEGITHEVTDIGAGDLFESVRIDTERRVLVLEAGMNKNGASNLTVRGKDRRGLSAETTFELTVTPVNDRPTALPIPPVVANPAADPVSLDIGEFFSDVDEPEGDRLTYGIRFNSNAEIFSKLEIDPQSGELAIEYSGFVSGEARVLVEAKDAGELACLGTLDVTLPKIPDPLVQVEGAPRMNRQTGLFEQRLSVVNESQRELGGFYLAVDGLPDGARLFNGAAADLDYNHVVPVGSRLSLVLEYFVPDRATPTGLAFASEATSRRVGTNPFPGQIFQIDRILSLPDGDVLIEFPTVVGRTCSIEYSSDGKIWRMANGTIRAAGNRVQWIDHGPPSTEFHPRDEPGGRRLYRVLHPSFLLEGN